MNVGRAHGPTLNAYLLIPENFKLKPCAWK